LYTRRQCHRPDKTRDKTRYEVIPIFSPSTGNDLFFAFYKCSGSSNVDATALQLNEQLYLGEEEDLDDLDDLDD
jgi:hypothetical protein